MYTVAFKLANTWTFSVAGLSVCNSIPDSLCDGDIGGDIYLR